MSKDLHHSIIDFFEARMNAHDCVNDYAILNDDDDLIYQINRAKRAGSLNVWLCDVYHFTETDFYNRPQLIGRGDYILIAKPEGSFSIDYDIIRRERIGVGQIRKFMGALNFDDPWRFLDAQEREKLKIRRL